MDVEIYWTAFAKQELKSIFDYHKEKVNLKIARQITRQIVEEAENLSSHPEMGQPEELLKGRKQEFRYIISTNYKIIYWTNKSKNRVEISDIFDTRQNPIKLKRNE
jgi:toxin ParE1/3/4